MGWWSRMTTAFGAGYQAFRESYLSTGDDPAGQDYGASAARRARYALLWATYEATVYRDIHRYARTYRAALGLYRYTRAVHSPAYRLGEFYAAHLWGGALDPEAGDGQHTPSAVPIVTDVPALREAIATLWRASNFGQRKAIIPRWGAILGDVAIRVVDDPARGQVLLQPVHPASLRDVLRDGMGHVKGYVIEETRPDPRRQAERLTVRGSAAAAPTVTYTEIATRDGDDVVYQTYLDGQPYDWGSGATAWAEPYGFVPLVVIPHLDVGMEWGLSELHAGLGKFREADDMASKLHDQIRKAVDAPMLLAGVTAPAATPTTTPSAATATRPEPGRQEIPTLYSSDPAAAVHFLVAPLDLAAVASRIDALIAELERDYPELQMDIWSTGATSGRALRSARQRVETRVYERRANYDTALVRAQQMAVAIGGHRGYDGYQGFGLESYAAGALDHTIGPRPVFPPDPLDDAEITTAFWQGAKTAADAGYPLELYLIDQGWDADRVAAYTALKRERQAAMAALAPPTPTPTAGGSPPDEPDEEPEDATD